MRTTSRLINARPTNYVTVLTRVRGRRKGVEELEAAAENVRAEYPDVLLDDAETSLKALITLYREAAESGKTVAVVVS